MEESRSPAIQSRGSLRIRAAKTRRHLFKLQEGCSLTRDGDGLRKILYLPTYLVNLTWSHPNVFQQTPGQHMKSCHVDPRAPERSRALND
jgi:hypothetical protein